MTCDKQSQSLNDFPFKPFRDEGSDMNGVCKEVIHWSASDMEIVEETRGKPLKLYTQDWGTSVMTTKQTEANWKILSVAASQDVADSWFMAAFQDLVYHVWSVWTIDVMGVSAKMHMTRFLSL